MTLLLMHLLLVFILPWTMKGSFPTAKVSSLLNQKNQIAKNPEIFPFNFELKITISEN